MKALYKKGLDSLGTIGRVIIIIAVLAVLFYFINSGVKMFSNTTACESQGGYCAPYKDCADYSKVELSDMEEYNALLNKPDAERKKLEITQVIGAELLPQYFDSCVGEYGKRMPPRPYCCGPLPGEKIDIPAAYKSDFVGTGSGTGATTPRKKYYELQLLQGSDASSPSARIYPGSSRTLAYLGGDHEFNIIIKYAGDIAKSTDINSLKVKLIKGQEVLGSLEDQSAKGMLKWKKQGKSFTISDDIYQYDGERLILEVVMLAAKDDKGDELKRTPPLSFNPALGDKSIQASIIPKSPVELRYRGVPGWTKKADFILTCDPGICSKYGYATITCDAEKNLQECLNTANKPDADKAMGGRQVISISDEGEARNLVVTVQTRNGKELHLIADESILIDKTSPTFDIYFSFTSQEMEFRCTDDKSACSETYNYKYVSDIKKFLSGIVSGSLNRNSFSMCPPAEEANAYTGVHIGTVMKYRYGDVRIICVRAKDNAGNYAIAAQVLYSAEDVLQALVAESIKEIQK